MRSCWIPDMGDDGVNESKLKTIYELQYDSHVGYTDGYQIMYLILKGLPVADEKWF